MSDVAQGETTLRLERLIPSPPEALFALWMQPDAIVRWWAPDGYAAEVQAWDATPGGRWRTSLIAADGRAVAAGGVFRVVDPPHRLVFTWTWEDASGAAGHQTEVSVDFNPAPGGTRLQLTHERFESRTARDDHDRGWSASLERMSRIVGG